MNKKIWFLAVVCSLALLAGCASKAPSSDFDTVPSGQEQPAPTQAADRLLGTWENQGQYEEGKDFVETMTLSDDGSAIIHLEYQGSDYATISGAFTADETTLTVHITSTQEPYDREYTYTLSGNQLELVGNGKTVNYVKLSD